MCGLIKRDTLMEADVGYALMPAFRGQGYAREAAAACVRYGHDVLGLPEVWGITGPDNAPSAARAAGRSACGTRASRGWSARSARPGSSSRRASTPGDDRAQIDALTRRFLAAFTNRDGVIPTLPALPHYFMLDATVRVADALGTITSTDLHGFIAPRAELLARGRLRRLRGARDRVAHRDPRRHRAALAALRQARHAGRRAVRRRRHQGAAVRAHRARLEDRVAAVDGRHALRARPRRHGRRARIIAP